MDNNTQIKDILHSIKESYPREILFPTQESGAFELIMNSPYAFCVAGCLDRGTKAEIIWTIPYWISKITGHFDPYKFYELSIQELSELLNQLPRRPRYINAAPRTFAEITALVVEKFEGKAERIWQNKSAIEVKRTFLSVYGVGSGIANMLVILIEDAFGETFKDLDRSNMDIKPDVHTMRVFYRLGLSAQIEEVEAIMAARTLNPEYPGKFDGPLWHTGKTWCHSSRPDCVACPLQNVCEKIDV